MGHGLAQIATRILATIAEAHHHSTAALLGLRIGSQCNLPRHGIKALRTVMQEVGAVLH